MGEKKPLQVMTKAGKSYVCLPSGFCQAHGPSYLVNGVEPTPAPGHPRWCIVDGPVESVVEVTHPSSVLVAWKLREECEALANYEARRPAEAFDRWDEYPPGDDRHFYEPVLEDQPPKHKGLPLVVVDRDTEPVKMPGYVRVEFPACLTEIPEAHHKYPCHVGRADVFGLVADRVCALVEAHASIYRVTDHRNIQVLCVQRKIEIPPEARVTRWEDYWPSLRSRKPKRRQVTRHERWEKVLEIVGTYDKPGDGAVITKDVRAENYASLQVKLEAYIADILGVLDTQRVQVCANCKGSGLVDAR